MNNDTDKAALEAAWRRVHGLLTEYRQRPRLSIDPSVPAPVLRFPVISHDEVLRILADKP
jgi:hypothetical protein